MTMTMYGLLPSETGARAAGRYQPCDYMFKFATSAKELESFWRLRRQIFCEEQQIFDESDRDRFDHGMIPIICTSLMAGMEDRVVGAVRIDQREPGIWWGSRLCVHPDFRQLRTVSPGVAIRNRQPAFYARRSIGAGLIYKAVSTAHGLGCRRFFAHVQKQNAVFFRRLHWHVLGEIELHGIVHVRMQADLKYYPPAEQSVGAVMTA